VWRHQESTYSNLYGFKNYGWDQVMANRGFLNYCVRWDSAASVSVAQRDAIHAFGLDDFYDWSPNVGGFLMKAGSATRITDFDLWMLRDWWRHLKSRYGL